ncbi:GNAT family N-acetyltransferase [Aestuariibacter salexigens]|uniref:GNAT family N-acetyltransferase n=1 Tax=Aestuariibacter salexigens TaxID=226010 RepID=UPI0003F69873|nr:GNAT family N-acetyltransferase [Aestuariibacter salexigens]
MHLVFPSEKYKRSYTYYIEELGDEERYPFPLDFDHTDFQAMLKRNRDFYNGINLPAGYAPSSTYWLIDGEDIVGVSNLRHYLNEQLVEAGGHIGLGVRPSRRQSGVGKTLLMLTLEQARQKNIHIVHIHCYADNRASASLIRACGGELESIVVSDKRKIARFIINQT